MRIGLIIYGSLETLSGGYLYDRMLVESLRRRGDEVEVISLPWRNYGWHLADNFSFGLVQRLRSARFDVLLQDELNHPSLFWLNRRLHGRVSYPIVAIVHHLRSLEERPAWQNRLYRWVERQYLASVDGFVMNSEATLAAVTDLVGNRRPAVVAYPAGDRLVSPITPRRILVRAQQAGPLRLIFVGNLIPRKGLHTLIDALARLGDQEWRLDVVGRLTVDPPYVRAIHQRIHRSGLADRISLRGPLTDEALSEALAESHALVVPSSYEGFGIVYLEALAFGLPAIATAAGGAGEIVTPGENGFLTQPGDSATLAGYLAELIGDRRRLIGMSLAAHQRYSQHPTWEVTAARVREFLERCRGDAARQEVTTHTTA